MIHVYTIFIHHLRLPHDAPHDVIGSNLSFMGSKDNTLCPEKWECHFVTSTRLSLWLRRDKFTTGNESWAGDREENDSPWGEWEKGRAVGGRTGEPENLTALRRNDLPGLWELPPGSLISMLARSLCSAAHFMFSLCFFFFFVAISHKMNWLH